MGEGHRRLGGVAARELHVAAQLPGHRGAGGLQRGPQVAGGVGLDQRLVEAAEPEQRLGDVVAQDGEPGEVAGALVELQPALEVLQGLVASALVEGAGAQVVPGPLQRLEVAGLLGQGQGPLIGVQVQVAVTVEGGEHGVRHPRAGLGPGVAGDPRVLEGLLGAGTTALEVSASPRERGAHPGQPGPVGLAGPARVGVRDDPERIAEVAEVVQGVAGAPRDSHRCRAVVVEHVLDQRHPVAAEQRGRHLQVTLDDGLRRLG